MGTVKQFLVQHTWALGLAAVVGLLSSLPMYLAPRALGDTYRGIPFMYQDNEVVYLSRVQELEDGHKKVSSPFLYEYKDSGTSIQPPIGEHLYWLPAHLFGVQITDVLVASKFVFPAILFLLLYGLVYTALQPSMSVRRVAALAGATVSVLGFDFIHLTEVLSIFSGSYHDAYLSIWTRLVHPISGALSLFSFLLCIRFVLGKRFWWATPGAGFLALTIGYIFAFGIGSAALGLFFLSALWFREWRTAAVLAALGVGALAISLPHLIAVWPLVFGVGVDVGLKNGLFLTHVPLINKVLVLSLIFAFGGLIYDIRKKITLKLHSPQFFFSMLLLAAFFAMNQHVVTGKTVWPQHFVQYTIPLVYLALISWYVVYLVPHIKRLAWAIPTLAIALSLAFGLVAFPTYSYQNQDYARVNRYASALEYLKNHRGECVVLPIEKTEHLNAYITALTHCDVYLTHYTFVGVPDERVAHNFFAYLRFQGVTPESIDAYFLEHPELVWRVFFRDWKDYFRHSSDPWLVAISDRHEIDEWIEAKKSEIIHDYTDFYSRDFYAELLRHRIDYVAWDRNGDTHFDSGQFPFLKEVFEGEGIVLYHVQ